MFGCTRVVWNDALVFCQENYALGLGYCGFTELSKRFLTDAKKTEDRQWLKEAPSIPLQQSLKDLDQAFKNFFASGQGKRKGQKINPPKLKKRKSKQSAKFTRNGFKVGQHKIYLSKIGKIQIVWSRELPAEPSSVTIIKDSADRYFASFVVDFTPEALPPSENSVGIDLGIIDFAILSNGEKIKSPKPLKKKLKRLRKRQRNLSRKLQGSKRREPRRGLRSIAARKKVA
jgi:putative transposase